MFEFSDTDIDSPLCCSYYTFVGDDAVECGFLLTVKGTEVLLTDSELDYMIAEVKNLKGK